MKWINTTSFDDLTTRKSSRYYKSPVTHVRSAIGSIRSKSRDYRGFNGTFSGNCEVACFNTNV